MFKKYRIKNKVRFTTFVCAFVLFVVFTGSSLLGMNTSSAASEVEPKIEYTEVRVSAGDTLWNLASEYGPKGIDVRETVYQICELNDVSAETLEAGSHILIPMK